MVRNKHARADAHVKMDEFSKRELSRKRIAFGSVVGFVPNSSARSKDHTCVLSRRVSVSIDCLATQTKCHDKNSWLSIEQTLLFNFAVVARDYDRANTANLYDSVWSFKSVRDTLSNSTNDRITGHRPVIQTRQPKNLLSAHKNALRGSQKCCKSMYRLCHKNSTRFKTALVFDDSVCRPKQPVVVWMRPVYHKPLLLQKWTSFSIPSFNTQTPSWVWSVECLSENMPVMCRNPPRLNAFTTNTAVVENENIVRVNMNSFNSGLRVPLHSNENVLEKKLMSHELWALS